LEDHELALATIQVFDAQKKSDRAKTMDKLRLNKFNDEQILYTSADCGTSDGTENMNALPRRSPENNVLEEAIRPPRIISPSIPSRAKFDGAAATREVQTICTVFKENRSKFSGDLNENIMDYIRQYNVFCRNLSLFDQRKYELMHNLFRDDAKEWFFANIVECVPTFSGLYNGAVIKLREE
jgi:hypothetical protein